MSLGMERLAGTPVRSRDSNLIEWENHSAVATYQICCLGVDVEVVIVVFVCCVQDGSSQCGYNGVNAEGGAGWQSNQSDSSLVPCLCARALQA